MRKLITSKFGWLLALIHAFLFAIALYQRYGSFHFYYEPFLLKILLLVDIVWFLLADTFMIGTLDHPTSGLVFTMFGGCAQFFIIGYLLSKLANRRN
jgi:hypothetical protein